jgi:hypothetical protein
LPIAADVPCSIPGCTMPRPEHRATGINCAHRRNSNPICRRAASALTSSRKVTADCDQPLRNPYGYPFKDHAATGTRAPRQAPPLSDGQRFPNAGSREGGVHRTHARYGIVPTHASIARSMYWSGLNLQSSTRSTTLHGIVTSDLSLQRPSATRRTIVTNPMPYGRWAKGKIMASAIWGILAGMALIVGASMYLRRLRLLHRPDHRWTGKKR